MIKVCHLSSAHHRFDTRIFYKQCQSLASDNRLVSLVIADGLGNENRDNISIFEPTLIGLGTQAQIVKYDAARQLLERTERFDRPIDTYLQLRWKHRVRVLTVWPNGVREHSSSLGGSLIGKERSSRDRLRREVLRPLYRAKLNIYAHINNRK